MIGLMIGFLLVGPVACWVFGFFNPMGYLLVPPWRVPKCTCGREIAHQVGCEQGDRMPR